MPLIGVKAKRTTLQYIRSGTYALITFEVTEFDTDGFWTSSQPDRVTIPAGKGGKYRVIMSRDSSGSELLLNGAQTLLLHTHPGTDQFGSPLSMGGLTWEGELAAGDVLHLREYNFGNKSVGVRPFLALYKIG